MEKGYKNYVCKTKPIIIVINFTNLFVEEKFPTNNQEFFRMFFRHLRYFRFKNERKTWKFSTKLILKTLLNTGVTMCVIARTILES
jgi:hypothetical protein